MSTQHRGHLTLTARAGALAILLGLAVSAWAASPVGSSGTDGGAQARSQTQTQEQVQTTDQEQARIQNQTQTETQTQAQEPVGTQADGAQTANQERLREREQLGTGPCASLDMLLNVYLGEQGTQLWLRTREQLRSASCQDTEAVLMTLSATEPAGDLDRVQDRLQDGSCLLVTPDACEGPNDYDHSHDYDHLYDYQAPGPHGSGSN